MKTRELNYFIVDEKTSPADEKKNISEAYLTSQSDVS